MSQISSKRKKVYIMVNSKRYRFDFKNLCAASEYFSTMFNGRFSESNNTEIVLKEVATKEFKYFHNMLHPTRKTKKITRGLHMQFILELLTFSDRFVNPNLAKLCYEEIERKMETKVLTLPLNLLEHALEYGYDKLMDIFMLWFNCQVVLMPLRTVIAVVKSREATCSFQAKLLKDYRGTVSKEAYEYVVNCIDEHNEYLNTKEIEIEELTKKNKVQIRELYHQMTAELNMRRRGAHYLKIRKLMAEIGLTCSIFELDFIK